MHTMPSWSYTVVPAAMKGIGCSSSLKKMLAISYKVENPYHYRKPKSLETCKFHTLHTQLL